MKIYEIGTGYTPIPAQMGAATEIVVEELTKAFLKCGQQVEIIDIAAADRAQTSLPIREVPVPKCFRGTDVQLGLMHKLKRVAYSVALAGELKRILKQTNEKVVLHFHNQYNLFFFLKMTPQRLRQKSLIAYTNHSGIWRLAWQEIEDTIRKRYFQEADCMKQADIVFVLNQQTKDNIMLHLGVPETRIVVIDNGVNTDVYRPLPAEEKDAAGEKWGLKDHRVILQVGSVYENKGQLRTVEYLLPLLKERSDLVYAYAGGIVDEDYQQRILQTARDNQLERQIRYLGMVPPGKELNELYNLATLTAFPSRYESFGLVVIESFSAGTPVLIEEAGHVRLGEGSVMFHGSGMAEVVERFLEKPENDCGETIGACRKNALDHYGWAKIAADYRKAFEDREK